MFSITNILDILQGSKYLLVFVAMFFEGPFATAAAAFAASYGVFNVYIIFLLSALGNIIPDFILFYLGRIGRKPLLDKYKKTFGLTKSRISLIEKNLQNQSGRKIIAIKLTPFLAIPGLMIAGASKMSWKKFIMADITFNLTSALLSTVLGFYYGVAAYNLLKYLNFIGAIIALIILLIIIFISRKITPHLTKKIEKP